MGYTQHELALELIKTEEGTNLLNKTDPKLAKGIMDELDNTAKFFKYSTYAKYGTRTLGGVGSFYTVYDDVKNNGKTKGEGVAHAGTAFAVGALAMAATPAGWAVGATVGAGIVATFLFEIAYNNSSIVQNVVDKIGHKLSEWGEAAKGMIMSHNPTMINPALQFMGK